MKRFQLLLITGILICSLYELSGQDVHLVSGNKTKTIKAGTFIDVRLPIPDQEPCAECPTKSVTGKLISNQDGKLNILVHTASENIAEGSRSIGYSYKKYMRKGSEPNLYIPVDSVLSITFKGAKHIRSRTVMESIGIALTAFGVGTGFSYLVEEVAGENSNASYAYLGLTEIIVGIAMGRSFPQKTYITSESCPQKHPAKKIWKFN
ncbi:MAG: hypothetical protein ABIQ02_09840 [Saprospiraceae bacterium]